MKKFLASLFALMMMLSAALADEPAMIDATNAPSIPVGTLSASLVSFTSNQTYAVYSAPDSKSSRGAKNRARVSTNGWIQVFGSEGDWILVQYDITDTHNRIGYIYKNALPADVTVPELNLTNVPAIVHYDVEVTDDPLVSRTALSKLPENTKVICLGSMGEWTYIEAEENGVRFRGFVHLQPDLCGILCAGQQEQPGREKPCPRQHQWLDSGVWQRGRLDSCTVRYYRHAQSNRIHL